MCRCVRDADRVESMKQHRTENDISTEKISVTKDSIELKCTRFSTRIRPRNAHQVGPILHALLQCLT